MIIKKDFPYTPNGKNRTLHIHLPNNYYESDERYPVMYFFDGHNLFFDADATYGKSWGLEDFLNQWDKPMIVVGMECGHEGNERLNEYSPYSYENKLFGEVNGIGDQTFRWIIQDIKPMIDCEFRTWSFREATAIAGSSMGGLMATYGIIKYNSVFSKAACISSALGLCMKELRKEIRAAKIDADTKVFLSWGTDEARGQYKRSANAHNNEICNKLQACGAQSTVYIQEGGHHCEGDWEKEIPLFMDYLWKQ